MDNGIVALVITSLLTGGIATELVNWLRNRKKDAATTELTDIQTLQAKLAYIEEVASNLRKHNIALQQDYDLEQERSRKMRARISELEEELDTLKRSAAQTQLKCQELGEKLAELLREDAA